MAKNHVKLICRYVKRPIGYVQRSNDNSMSEKKKAVIGIMDPNSFSFRGAIEGLLNHIDQEVTHNGETYELVSRRIMSRPYNVLGAKTTCNVILNRGAHWNPHHNSFFHMVMPHSYMINDMISFKSIDKNTSYGHMYELGMHIPPTWAIPQADYTDLIESDRVELDLIFPDYEMFDLTAIGEEVGYPAFMKPQNGGGWVDVIKVDNPQELHNAYHKIKDKPVNLQKAVDFKEFVRTVGVGPQMFPMHYNAGAEHSHDRYLRNEHQAIEHNFISGEKFKEVSQITKIINAFYNWDHNSCEILIDHDDVAHPIDYANAYPDSNITSLHFYFPDLVKGMVKWLIFVAVSGRKKPLFAEKWDEFFAVKDKAEKEGWSYQQKLDAYEAIADDLFQTKAFNEFCAKSLPNFEQQAHEYFASEDFQSIIEESVERYFKFAHEWPQKKMHYLGIHQFWLHCEATRLGLNASDEAPAEDAAVSDAPEVPDAPPVKEEVASEDADKEKVAAGKSSKKSKSKKNKKK